MIMRRWQRTALVAATTVAALALGACASGGRERFGGEVAAGDGMASGHGSCNRFRPVVFDRDSISFGPLIATRMFCGDAVTNQENAYMSALADVDRYEVRESFLYLYAPRLPAPLRFVRE